MSFTHILDTAFILIDSSYVSVMSALRHFMAVLGPVVIPQALSPVLLPPPDSLT